MAAEFSVGEEPAIRRAAGDRRSLEGYRCPFCGSERLLISDTDLPIDTERVEAYCDNASCDAREIVILVVRGAGTHDRADVSALRAVDRGSYEEQEQGGAIIERDAKGNVTSVAWSYRESSRKLSRGERDHRTLHRRRRPTRIVVTPEPDEG